VIDNVYEREMMRIRGDDENDNRDNDNRDNDNEREM
jgi:hypothetical protein